MITTSEIAVTATIWVLTSTGVFFGTRAALSRIRLRREHKVAPKMNSPET